MTDHDDEDRRGEQEPELPERPQARQEETVRALEEKTRSDPDDGERVAGDDVADNPDTDELEGVPGPSPDEPAEPSG